MGRGSKVALGMCALALAFIGGAQATPGDLDTTFGTGGKLSIDFGDTDYGYGVAVQPDGKLVIAASTYNAAADEDFVVARLNANGTLDSNFGSGGKVITPIGAAINEEPYAVTLQPDGKIIAAGYTISGGFGDFALVRYNADGSLDTSFDTDGKVTTAIGTGSDYVEGVAVQSDGKIVAAGFSFNGSNNDFAVVRYNANGSLDTSFDTDGKVTTAVGTGEDAGRALVIQSDGKIVVGGYSYQGVVNGQDFALARYNADGSLDTSFDTDGKVTTPIGPGPDLSFGLAVQTDGKLVAAGYASNGTNYDLALARYNADGSLDTGFGGSGKVTTAIGSSNDFGDAVVVQPDGKIVVVATTYNGANYDFALARYNADGSLDTGFGSGGRVTTAVGPTNDDPWSAALQADGKIVVVGSSFNGTTDDAALVRYLGNTLTVTKTGTGTGTVTSSPAGIDCGSACSAPLAARDYTLTATETASSWFMGWSGACSGSGACSVKLDADKTVTAAFDLACIVPKVKGRKLTPAKRSIRSRHCAVGKVRKAFSKRVKKGRVISQRPRPGTKRAPGAKVALVVSKGKRP